MKVVLLNKISASASFSTGQKKYEAKYKKIRERLKPFEQRKMDNLRRTVDFFKEMGEQDIAYFKSTHQELVDLVRTKKHDDGEYDAPSPTVYPDEVRVVEDDDIFDN